MVCISGDKTVLYTADKHKIKKGDILYYEFHDDIRCIKVGYWNNGKKADLYFNTPTRHKAYVDIKGYGGKGVYAQDEDNVYIFIPSCKTYFSLEKCKQNMIRKLEKLIKKIKAKEISC